MACNDEKINSILELFDNYKVVIPAIQRDYAQGRVDPKYDIAGSGFIDYILDGDNSKTIDVIFGRGYCDNDGKKVLNPIDGQQRLTTIWLLLVYLASNIQDNDIRKYWKNVLSNFSYETRVSSRLFIEEIIKHYFEPMDSDTTINTNEDDNYDDFSIDNKEKIVKNTWFINTWLLDPTVAGMLRSIDYIHNKVVNKQIDSDEKRKELLNNISNISFELILIDESDEESKLDTYIKMNNRGVELSNFENFKADYIDYINDNEFIDETIKINTIKSINNEWNDIFYREINNQVDESEEYFFDLFLRIICCYDIKLHDYNNLGETFIGNEEIEDYHYRRFDRIKEIFDSAKLENDDIIKNIHNFFTNLTKLISNNNEKGFDKWLRDTMPKWTAHNDSLNDYNLIINKEKKNGFQVYPLLMTYGIFIFISNTELNIDEYLFNFKNWVRMICNIIENANIDSYKALKPYLEGCDKYYDYYIKNIKGNYRQEFYDEKYKNELIKSDRSWYDIIVDAENKYFYCGGISFLFDYNKKGFNDKNEFKKNIKRFDRIFDDAGLKKVKGDKYFWIKQYMWYILSNIKDNNDFTKKTKHCITKVTSEKNESDSSDALRKFMRGFIFDAQEFLLDFDIKIDINKVNSWLTSIVKNECLLKEYLSNKSEDNLLWKINQDYILQKTSNGGNAKWGSNHNYLYIKESGINKLIKKYKIKDEDKVDKSECKGLYISKSGVRKYDNTYITLKDAIGIESI